MPHLEQSCADILYEPARFQDHAIDDVRRRALRLVETRAVELRVLLVAAKEVRPKSAIKFVEPLLARLVGTGADLNVVS